MHFIGHEALPASVTVDAGSERSRLNSHKEAAIRITADLAAVSFGRPQERHDNYSRKTQFHELCCSRGESALGHHHKGSSHYPSLEPNAVVDD